VIELVALYIGVRLSRSMTLSVAELYSATEHVNRGDLTHRTQVRSRDQMGALEQSFNSMTESLARLQPLSRIGDVITGSVTDWIGDAEQPDDVTIVLARAR
jgi:nitrogen fixation/metabolism regulation signal transduction histidine kinase